MKKKLVKALLKIKAFKTVRKLIALPDLEYDDPFKDRDSDNDEDDEETYYEQTPGVSMVESLIDEIEPKLEKQGYLLLKELGSGEFGIIYDIGANKVLKITIDFDEAHTSASLIHKELKYVIKIFRVFVFKSIDDEIWFIEQEKLDPLSNSEKGNFEFLEENRWHTDHVKHYLALDRKYKLQSVEGYINYFKEKTPERAVKRIQNFKNFLKRVPVLSKMPAVLRGYLLDHYNSLPDSSENLKSMWPHLQELLLGLEELYKASITFSDTHPNNIMKTPSGIYKWVDIGAGSYGGGQGQIEELNANSLFIKNQ